MWCFALVLTLLAAADTPFLDPEPLQHDVRKLDAEIIKLPRHVPAGYLIGAGASVTVGLALVPLTLFFGSISLRGGTFSSTGAGVMFVAAWVLVGVSILGGLALVLEGIKAEDEAAILREELVRKRDALLRQLRQPSPDAAFDAITTF